MLPGVTSRGQLLYSTQPHTVLSVKDRLTDQPTGGLSGSQKTSDLQGLAVAELDKDLDSVVVEVVLVGTGVQLHLSHKPHLVEEVREPENISRTLHNILVV